MPSIERIMQIGKKKLVLDHLIVQKMGDDTDGAGENIQSILSYGAQALFEEEDEGEKSRGITCECARMTIQQLLREVFCPFKTRTKIFSSSSSEQKKLVTRKTNQRKA
jgi:hypothetical protein